MSKSLELFLGSVLAASVLAGPAMADKLGLGREALPEEISAWDTAVLPDGQGCAPVRAMSRRGTRFSPTTAPRAMAISPRGWTAGRCWRAATAA